MITVAHRYAFDITRSKGKMGDARGKTRGHHPSEYQPARRFQRACRAAFTEA